jgi:uncharacterized membrane protein YesL
MATMATRAVRACAEVVWIAKLNAVWILLTLLGAVVLGLGPATLAAATVSRRHHRGEDVRIAREAWAAYRRAFVPGNLIGLPLLAVGLLLAWNRRYADGTGNVPMAVLVGCAAAGYAAIVAVLPPMYAHYDLPLRGYLPAASKFVLVNLPGSILLIFILLAVGFVSYLMPGLLIFVSFGLWITADSYLCQRFFAANDDRIAARVSAAGIQH